MVFAAAGSYTLNGLSPATQYNCSVFASTSHGGGPTTTIEFTTPDDGTVISIISRDSCRVCVCMCVCVCVCVCV